MASPRVKQAASFSRYSGTPISSATNFPILNPSKLGSESLSRKTRFRGSSGPELPMPTACGVPSTPAQAFACLTTRFKLVSVTTACMLAMVGRRAILPSRFPSGSNAAAAIFVPPKSIPIRNLSGIFDSFALQNPNCRPSRSQASGRIHSSASERGRFLSDYPLGLHTVDGL